MKVSIHKEGVSGFSILVCKQGHNKCCKYKLSKFIRLNSCDIFMFLHTQITLTLTLSYLVQSLDFTGRVWEAAGSTKQHLGCYECVPNHKKEESQLKCQAGSYFHNKVREDFPLCSFPPLLSIHHV